MLQLRKYLTGWTALLALLLGFCGEVLASHPLPAKGDSYQEKVMQQSQKRSKAHAVQRRSTQHTSNRVRRDESQYFVVKRDILNDPQISYQAAKWYGMNAVRFMSLPHDKRTSMLLHYAAVHGLLQPKVYKLPPPSRQNPPLSQRRPTPQAYDYPSQPDNQYPDADAPQYIKDEQ